MRAQNHFSRRNPVYALVVLLVAAVSLSACETTSSLNAVDDSGSGITERRVSQNFYSPFFDRADHLAQLVQDGNFDDAATLFDEQLTYFTIPKNREANNAMLRQIAAKFNDSIAGTAGQNLEALGLVQVPLSVNEWEKTKILLIASKNTISNYPDIAILRDSDFRLVDIDSLKEKISQVTRLLESNVNTAIAKFDHFGDKSFFDSYPIPVNARTAFGRNFDAIVKKVDNASATELEKFIEYYPPKTTLSVELYDRASRAYRKHLIAEQVKVGAPSLVKLFSVLKKLKESGFRVTGDDEEKIGFVEVTSKTLLKEGQIEFPVAVDVDISITSIKTSLEEALSNPDGPKYLLIIDIALAKASRRVLGIKKIPSKVLTGYKEEANPEYNIVQNQINNARLSVQQAAMGQMSADSQYCTGLACFVKIIGQVAAQVVVTKAQENLNGAMTKLGNTPPMLKHPIYAKYKFDKASIKANKSMTVHYYVVDMVEGKYFKSSFDIIENKSFEVAYRVLDDDPNKVSHISKNNTEKDVTDWEEAVSSIKLSMMIEHYIENIESSQQLPDIAQLRTEILKDKNTALAKYKSEKYNARPLNDPRFDHVVVVYTGSGSFGSGFFIKDDIVLTNWHVVENSAFVELKTYDGQETFGKVIAQDVRVDLALVKVQTRGKPVIFYTKNTIDLGQTVEAIGHPKGLEFSITRGVISAIREHPSINLPVGGADDVLFIQIDTPINPGNSGGPLFLGDKVVGVNTWGLKKNIAEGLNFAVHYSEVIKFIRENVPSFQTSQ